MRAARKDPFGTFVKTSKCRNCGLTLKWGDRTYDFDHKDNNPANNSQNNCYLVCKICHGKHTRIEKRAVRGWFGEAVGYKTVKRKVGYKKPKPAKTKRVAVRDSWGDIVRYRTVKIKKTKPKTKDTKGSSSKRSVQSKDKRKTKAKSKTKTKKRTSRKS
jgi:hypothetical protein